MRFSFQSLAIHDVILVRETRLRDARGFFAETYRRSAFSEAGIDAVWLQDNHAHSRGGVLRGLHYQLPPRSQAKLVRVVRGEVFDVVVDLRRGSPTYLRWLGVPLTGEEGASLYVPPGFAHGYLVLSESADLTYKVSEPYEPTLDRGIRWDDPDLAIAWPVDAPELSGRDRGLPFLAEAENPFVFPGRDGG